MQIAHVRENKKAYLRLLLLADEQEEMIDRYLDRGFMYVLTEHGEAAAVLVVTDESQGVLEVKNLAVREDRQGCGLGKKMLEFVEEQYRDAFHTLLVGTGDSPLTVPFYEKCGFVRSHVVKGFFTEHYDHPIIEGGVLLRDMVYLKKSI